MSQRTLYTHRIYIHINIQIYNILYMYLCVRLLSRKFRRNCQRPHVAEYEKGLLGVYAIVVWVLSYESEPSLLTP